jgi:hypothetical protein
VRPAWVRDAWGAGAAYQEDRALADLEAIEDFKRGNSLTAQDFKLTHTRHDGMICCLVPASRNQRFVAISVKLATTLIRAKMTAGAQSKVAAQSGVSSAGFRAAW